MRSFFHGLVLGSLAVSAVTIIANLGLRDGRPGSPRRRDQRNLPEEEKSPPQSRRHEKASKGPEAKQPTMIKDTAPIPPLQENEVRTSRVKMANLNKSARQFYKSQMNLMCPPLAISRRAFHRSSHPSTLSWPNWIATRNTIKT